MRIWKFKCVQYGGGSKQDSCMYEILLGLQITKKILTFGCRPLPDVGKTAEMETDGLILLWYTIWKTRHTRRENFTNVKPLQQRSESAFFFNVTYPRVCFWCWLSKWFTKMRVTAAICVLGTDLLCGFLRWNWLCSCYLTDMAFKHYLLLCQFSIV